MARVTVEDCIDKVENRFELVLLASHRARQISQGGQITISRDNDKNPVVALREIADETLSPGDLKEDLIHSLQKHAGAESRSPIRSVTCRLQRRRKRLSPKTISPRAFLSARCRKKSCSLASKDLCRRKKATTIKRLDVA